MSRTVRDHSVLIGLLAVVVLALVLISDHTRPGSSPDLQYRRVASSYGEAIEWVLGDKRQEEVLIGLAAIEVAGGRPRQVFLYGGLDREHQRLEEMFGSVLDKTDQQTMPMNMIQTALEQDLFTTTWGDVLIAKEQSPSHRVVVVIDALQGYVMPIELLDRLSQGGNQ